MSSSPDPNRLRAAFNRLIYSEGVPSVDAVLALGAELANAHLADFIYPTIDADRSNLPAAYLAQMLYAATRLHLPGFTPEDCERMNDKGHVLGKLADVEQNHRWPAMRSELVKFSKRVYEEVEARTPPPPECERAEGTGADSDQAKAEQAEGTGTPCNKGRAGSAEGTVPEGDSDQSGWLKVTQAARVAGCNRGVITAAVNAGKLMSNGKAGRDRRIDPADLSRWQLARAERAEPGETEAAIRRKLDNAARSDLRSID